MDSKDYQIIAMAAAHDAAEVFASYVRVGLTPEWDVNLYEKIRLDIMHGTIAAASEAENLGVASVQAAFPGAQVQAPAPAYAPPPVPQYAQAPAPQNEPFGAAPIYPPAQQGYAPPPQQQYAPPQPATPPPAAASSGCPSCGGAQYDNRAENDQKRQGGFAVGPDFKCRNDACKKAVWPADYEARKHLPKKPR